MTQSELAEQVARMFPVFRISVETDYSPCRRCRRSGPVALYTLVIPDVIEVPGEKFADDARFFATSIDCLATKLMKWLESIVLIPWDNAASEEYTNRCVKPKSEMESDTIGVDVVKAGA